MAEDIAREIIAQSQGGSKLAFSFKVQAGEVLLYTSKGADEKIRYHVLQSDGKKQNEFKYAGLEVAVNLIQILVPLNDSNSYSLDLALYDSAGGKCDQLGYLGWASSKNLMCFLQEKIANLDMVNVEVM